jgi:hypothetical protein
MPVLTCCSSLLCAIVLTANPALIETPDILPAAKAGFTIDAKGDSAPSLLDLVIEYQRVTGLNLVIGKDVREGLSKSETGLRQPLVVPPEKVHTLVELFLAQGGYCTALLHASDPILVAVKRMQGTSISGNAVFVDAGKLASVANHPALLCWTVFDLDALEVGEITNRLQAQWEETDFHIVIAFGSSHRVLLMGKGSDVATRARVLQDLNESTRRKAEAADKSVPPAGSKGSATK